MTSTATVAQRIEDLLREVATLFIALAPLDVVLGTAKPQAVMNGLIFVAVGVSLFAVSLIAERTRTHAWFANHNGRHRGCPCRRACARATMGAPWPIQTQSL